MSDTFRQTRGIIRLEAEIRPDSVWYAERSLFRSSESVIPWDHIDEKPVRKSQIAKLQLVLCIFFGMVLFQSLLGFAAGDNTLVEVVTSALFLSLPAVFLWIYSPRLVGYESLFARIMFFDRKGKDDPAPFMRRILDGRRMAFQQAAEAAASERPAARGRRQPGLSRQLNSGEPPLPLPRVLPSRPVVVLLERPRLA